MQPASRLDPHILLVFISKSTDFGSTPYTQIYNGSFQHLDTQRESNCASVWAPICFATATKSPIPSPLFDATCESNTHQRHLTHTGASSHTWLGSTARAWFTERSPSRRFLSLCSNDGCCGADVSWEELWGPFGVLLYCINSKYEDIIDRQRLVHMDQQRY